MRANGGSRNRSSHTLQMIFGKVAKGSSMEKQGLKRNYIGSLDIHWQKQKHWSKFIPYTETNSDGYRLKCTGVKLQRVDIYT